MVIFRWDDNVFFLAITIGINGFSMVLLPLDHHHLMFFNPVTFNANGFFYCFGVTQPSPLNDFQPPDHWFQWFFDGLGPFNYWFQ